MSITHYQTHEHPFGDDNPQVRSIKNRLKTIEGHVRGVQRMLDEGAYCVDVMKQMKAIRQAVERTNGLLLEVHLNHCVAPTLEHGDAEVREQALREIIDVFNANGRI